jgi:FkbM family methyltransferase
MRTISQGKHFHFGSLLNNFQKRSKFSNTPSNYRANGRGINVISDLIYDVGMYNGDDTEYYLAKGFRVVAVEANPQAVKQTTQRFKQEVATGKVVILPIGVSDREGSLPFYISKANPEWNSFDSVVLEDKPGSFEQVTISCRRFRSILDQFGTPFYLKLDIENSEIHCLQDLIRSDLPSYVSFEKSATYSIESLTLLHELGYTGFKLIGQYNLLPVQYPPTVEQQRFERWRHVLASKNLLFRVVRRAGLRQWINPTRYRSDWTFPAGSSGPFGEGTSGRWQTFDEIMATLTKANAAFAAREPSVFWGAEGFSFWADFHAKL